MYCNVVLCSWWLGGGTKHRETYTERPCWDSFLIPTYARCPRPFSAADNAEARGNMQAWVFTAEAQRAQRGRANACSSQRTLRLCGESNSMLGEWV